LSHQPFFDMSISRAAFQIRIPGKVELGARQVARAVKDLGIAAQPSEEAIPGIDVSTENCDVTFDLKADGDQRAEQNLPENHAPTPPNLPPADAPSAGTQDAIGPNQPQTDTRRSVATGRDAPHSPAVPESREVKETDWNNAQAQMQVIERRLRGQKNATAEEINGIHTIVERLLELTEAHLFEGGQKLQSLEHKLAQLEMRSSLNRSSP
jgi:hypothetical protein